MSNSDKLDLLPGLWWLVDASPFRAFVQAIILTPVIMLVFIIPILEDRRPAPFRYQFKAFVIGDPALACGLAFMVALADRLPEREAWWNTGWMQVLAVTGAAATFYVSRNIVDSQMYSTTQLGSPSKIYHDFVVLPVYSYLLIKIGVAVLFGASWSHWPLKLGVLAFIGLWAAMLRVDSTQPVWRQRQLASHAHDGNWQPIWYR